MAPRIQKAPAAKRARREFAQINPPLRDDDPLLHAIDAKVLEIRASYPHMLVGRQDAVRELILAGRSAEEGDA